MAQMVSRQLLTLVAKVQTQISPCDICGGLSCTGTVFSPSTLVFPCHHDSTCAPYSSLSTRSSYQKNKRAKPGGPLKSNALWEIGELSRKLLSLFSFSKGKICTEKYYTCMMRYRAPASPYVSVPQTNKLLT